MPSLELLSQGHCNTVEQDNRAGDDRTDNADTARWRAEHSQNISQALEFWSTSPEWQIRLLFFALAEQKIAMTHILRSTSIEHELSRLDEQQNTGCHSSEIPLSFLLFFLVGVGLMWQTLSQSGKMSL